MARFANSGSAKRATRGTRQGLSRIGRALKRGGSAERPRVLKWFFKEESNRRMVDRGLGSRCGSPPPGSRKKSTGRLLIEVADQLFSGPVLEEKVAACVLRAKLGRRQFDSAKALLQADPRNSETLSGISASRDFHGLLIRL